MKPLLTVPSLEAEQCNLPGLPGFFPPAWPALSPVDIASPRPAGIPTSPGQLHFGASQEPLSEPAGSPCQLPLLPDPPVWEAEPAEPSAKHRKRRPPRKRTDPALSRGQMSLF